MVSLVIIGSALLAASPERDTKAAPDLAGYETAKAAVGHDPKSQIRLALWCEAHGLPAERLKHLAIAVLTDPSNATARGLMGLVSYRGHWSRPEAVGQKVKDDAALSAALAEYNGRRERAAKTAEAQWRLALWCEEHGLTAEATAHFSVVVQLDPGREAAWKRLGYKKHQGRWKTDAQVAAESAEADAQKRANQHWKPVLTRLRASAGDQHRRDETERSLAAITDPRAVPSIWTVFIDEGSGERDQAIAVQLLGQLDAPRASRGLAMLAVFSDSAEVRRAATETLRGRDTRDFLGSVIALLRRPVKYEVRPVGGPGSPGVLFVEGERFNVRRLYAPPPMPPIPLFAGESVTFDGYGLPVISRYLGSEIETSQRTSWAVSARGPLPNPAHLNGINPRRFSAPSEWTVTTQTSKTPVEHSMQIPIGQLMLQYQMSAAVAWRQQFNDIQIVENYNNVVDRLNDRATQVLRGVTGVDRGSDSQAWMTWWVDQLGYVYTPPTSMPVPTYDETVPIGYIPSGVAVSTSNQAGPTSVTTAVATALSPGGFIHMCFKGGTPVHTLSGLQAIETVQVGDRVLTQDVATGALSYQPVLAVFHNRPAATLRIKTDAESIAATLIHRFWKAGSGWVMARDLKPGDALRTLGGTAVVQAVESDQVQPVFNLQVADGSSFFVGTVGTLAHDNSVTEPVSAPFDAPPSLATK